MSSDCILPVDNESLITIVNRILHSSHARTTLLKSGTTLIDNTMGTALPLEKQKHQAFDAMNNIIANLILNLTW